VARSTASGNYVADASIARRRSAARASDTLVVLVLAWGALTFGAVYPPWAYWPLAVACGLMGLQGLRTADQDGVSRPLAAALAVIALGIVVQLVPVPRALALRASPGVDAYLREYSLG
jgi:hypothetical protein